MVRVAVVFVVVEGDVLDVVGSELPHPAIAPAMNSVRTGPLRTVAAFYHRAAWPRRRPAGESSLMRDPMRWELEHDPRLVMFWARSLRRTDQEFRTVCAGEDEVLVRSIEGYIAERRERPYRDVVRVRQHAELLSTVEGSEALAEHLARLADEIEADRSS